MEEEQVMNGKLKKAGLIKKTLERCRSLTIPAKKADKYSRDGRHEALKKKSKSWPSLKGKLSQKLKVAPEGCFSVYVGPEKQRFVIKTEYVNHPLFKMLLEEAESEYGYSSQGPLALPCDVDFFIKVLKEMDGHDDYDDDDDDDQILYHHHHLQYCCSPLPRSPISYHRLTPSRLISINQF